MPGDKRDGSAGRLVYDADAKVYRVEDPWVHNMQWPGVSVDSSAFNAQPAGQQCFELSAGYLRAAMALCRRAGDAGEQLEWADAAVCYYCMHHATELFLKACLLSGKQGSAPRVHEVADLFDAYERRFTGEEFFFHTPWRISAEDLDKAVGQRVIRGVDRVPDQLFRYGRDNRGQPSAGTQYFTPGYMLNYLGYLSERWHAIRQLVSDEAG